MSELPLTPPPEDKPAATAQPKPRAVPVKRPMVRRPPIIVPETSRRDTFIALACGGGVLLLVVLGILVLHNDMGKPPENLLTGVIVAKHDAGQTEKEISVGKKGLASKETDSGFSFDVKVASENGRIFEVPVNEANYMARKVGDTQQFIRPLSEQK